MVTWRSEDGVKVSSSWMSKFLRLTKLVREEATHYWGGITEIVEGGRAKGEKDRWWW
jgi:hypothetical protein